MLVRLALEETRRELDLREYLGLVEREGFPADGGAAGEDVVDGSGRAAEIRRPRVGAACAGEPKAA